MIVDRLAGSRSRLPISLIISIRSHLKHQPTTSLLAVFAIASSVGLAIASETSFRSVGAALESSAEALVGEADLQITAGEPGVPEQLLETIRATPGVLSASPMIYQTFMIPRGPNAGRGIRVLGVDLLEDRGVRSYDIRSSGLEVRDPLRLLTLPESLIVTGALASRLGLQEGDSLPVRSVRGELELVVRGSLADGGVTEAWGGQLAIMDIYGLQMLLGREGWVDRIDIVMDEGVERADLMARLETDLDGRFAISEASFRDSFVDTWLGVLNAGLLSMVVVGISTSVLLSYGVVSLEADRRMKEFALLAAAGLEQPRIRKLIFVDALVLAALGTTLGGALGVPLSQAALSMFSGASQNLHDVEIPPLEPGVLTICVAVAVGLGVALLGALEPARRAGTRDPIDILRSPRVEPGGPAPWAIRIALVLGLIGSAIWLLETQAPIVRAALTLFLGGMGVVALALASAPTLVRAIRPILARTVRRVGYLAGGHLEARPLEAGIALAAIVLISGGLVMSLVITQTIVVSVDGTVKGLFEGGYYVRALGTSQTMGEQIPSRVIAQIRGVEGVEDVAEFYGRRIQFRNEEVNVDAVSASALVGRATAAFMDPRALEGLLRGELAMSHGFGRHFGVSVGDVVELTVGNRSRSFRIAGVYAGWGDEKGSLRVDSDVFDSYWGRDGADFLSLWIDGPPNEVLDRVRAGAPGYDLLIISSDQMGPAEARLRRFGSLLYVVTGVMGALVGAAMLNMLAGAVMARSQEFALLQSSGATPANVVGLVLLDGLVIAVVGCAAGLGFGLLGAEIIRDAITLDRGWMLILSVDAVQLATALTVVVVSCVAFALYPAWLGTRIRADGMQTGQ